MIHFWYSPHLYIVAGGLLSQRLIWRFWEAGSEMRREIISNRRTAPRQGCRKAGMSHLLRVEPSFVEGEHP